MSYQWQTMDFDDLSPSQLYAALRLRQAVFAIEQASLYQDLDDRDQPAAHMFCWRGHSLLAYQRCLPPGVSYRDSAIGRIVVAAQARGHNLGRELVRRGIRYNLQRWPDSDIRINAQAYLEDFYRRLGFETQGDRYDEDGIPHIEMLYRRSAHLE